MMVSRLFIFAAFVVAASPYAVDIGSFNSVPSAPRELRRAGWIAARGAMPARLNECAILASARYRRTLVVPQSLLPGGTDAADYWGQFCGPRAFTKLIQPLPFVDSAAVRATIPADAPDVRINFPVRPADAPSGSAFQRQITALPRDLREAAVLHEIISGNVPEFLRRLKPIRVEATDDTGARHVATYFVMPDYLSIGTDDDFFRVPITPATATAIADQFDASLITAKVSDDVFAAAEVKLDPKPLTEDRDTVATFWRHHQIIEEQMRGKSLGQLVAGIKKDVVLTNRLKEKPHKVAIYGWHELNGQPIQSLYVGHVDWYVDYSHGVRLMSQQIIVDNQPMKVSDVLKDSRLCPLLSTEGPIDVAEVRNAAEWGR